MLPDTLPANFPLRDVVLRSPDSFTILVVDDNKTILSLYRIMLGRDGYKVITTPNSADALEVCRRMEISLIISDVMRPVMDGFTMLKIISEDPATKHIPLIFCTCLASPENVQYGLSLGARAYLTKPIVPLDFLQVVKDTLPVDPVSLQNNRNRSRYKASS